MFWSGNYNAAKELMSLLRNENVTLRQVLEADDILQECNADNATLRQFLTRPDILDELITLITEEPSKDVELQFQYRHACIACEVLTSHIATLSDKLSEDTVQMNRLCDFINREPPLNPLLASFFSKVVEMLLERSAKQDWYQYHIVALRVIDLFKSRTEFLPNLLRHMSTSSIVETLKCFLKLDDLFSISIMDWFDDHQLLDSLIQIVCGTYVPEKLVPNHVKNKTLNSKQNENPEANHVNAITDATANHCENFTQQNVDAVEDRLAEERVNRIRAAASDNAALLLCDIVHDKCGGDDMYQTKPTARWLLAAALRSAATVRALLAAMFTAPAATRRRALVNGGRLLRSFFAPNLPMGPGASGGSAPAAARPDCMDVLQQAVAPHLPLLHQVLLQNGEGRVEGGVGVERLMVAELMSVLSRSLVEEVATTLITLGTMSTLMQMMLAYSNNNFLHAAVVDAVGYAVHNPHYRFLYGKHLLIECDLLTTIMDAFEDGNKPGRVRPAYMGHLAWLARRVAAALNVEVVGVASAEGAEPEAAATPKGAEGADTLSPAVARRWTAFCREELEPRLRAFDSPLGGYYPTATLYQGDQAVEGEFAGDQAMQGEFEFTDTSNNVEIDDSEYYMNENSNVEESEDNRTPDEILNQTQLIQAAIYDCLNRAGNRDVHEDAKGCEGDDEDEGEEVGASLNEQAQQVLFAVAPWDSNESKESNEAPSSGEGWAQFSGDTFPDPFLHEADASQNAFASSEDFFNAKADAFAANAFTDPVPFYANFAEPSQDSLAFGMSALTLSSGNDQPKQLANSADIVNANRDSRPNCSKVNQGGQSTNHAADANER